MEKQTAGGWLCLIGGIAATALSLWLYINEKPYVQTYEIPFHALSGAVRLEVWTETEDIVWETDAGQMEVRILKNEDSGVSRLTVDIRSDSRAGERFG